jgi:hypothetical protein
MKSEFCLDALIVFSYTNRNIYTKVIEIGSENTFSTDSIEYGG